MLTQWSCRPWTADVDWDSHASATQQYVYGQLHDRGPLTDRQALEHRSVRLSAEIKAFTQYISPTDQEHELRSCVVESIRRLIVGRWRDAQVHAFGSFETRLYLPTGYVYWRTTHIYIPYRLRLTSNFAVTSTWSLFLRRYPAKRRHKKVYCIKSLPC